MASVMMVTDSDVSSDKLKTKLVNCYNAICFQNRPLVFSRVTCLQTLHLSQLRRCPIRWLTMTPMTIWTVVGLVVHHRQHQGSQFYFHHSVLFKTLITFNSYSSPMVSRPTSPAAVPATEPVEKSLDPAMPSYLSAADDPSNENDMNAINQDIAEAVDENLADQTTLLHNEEESFALAPVDASALKGSYWSILMSYRYNIETSFRRCDKSKAQTKADRRRSKEYLWRRNEESTGQHFGYHHHIGPGTTYKTVGI